MSEEELITFLAYEGGREVSVRPDDIMGLEDMPATENHAERTRIDMRPPEKGEPMFYLVKQPASYIRRAMVRNRFKMNRNLATKSKT